MNHLDDSHEMSSFIFTEKKIKMSTASVIGSLKVKTVISYGGIGLDDSKDPADTELMGRMI